MLLARISRPLTYLGRLNGLVARGLDVFLPPRCISCSGRVQDHGALCLDCWNGIRFLSPPACAQCGLPFPFDLGPNVLCPSCIAEPPPFERARSALAYDDHSKRLILALKHADRQHGLPAFGQWLARAGSELLAEADMVAPVPLHWTRLFARRFNQSAMLAQAVLAVEAKTGRTPPRFEPMLLTRHKRTPPQGRRTRRGRAANVQGAFRLGAGMDVAGRRILLIDDVLTTGATIAECARVLRRAGAARVDVLTLARVIRE